MSDLPKQPPPQFDSRQGPVNPNPPPARSTRRGGRGRGRAGMTTDTRTSVQPGPFTPHSASFAPSPYAQYTIHPHPSPPRLPPLTIPPPPTFSRPVYQSPPQINQAPSTRPHLPLDVPPPQRTQPRIGSLINEAQALWTPPGSSSPYSPRYPAQVSPGSETGPHSGQKRPFEPSQHEDPRYQEPLPSPYTEHRDSWSSLPSHRGSATSSTGLGPSLHLPMPSAASSIPEPPRSHRSSGQSSTGFPGPLQQPFSTATPQPPMSTNISQPSFSGSNSQLLLPITATASPLNPLPSRQRLYIRQQPIAARACGFGERDRRVIDPPPILQLLLTDFDPTSPADIAELRGIHVVICSLLSANESENRATDSNDVTIMHEGYNKPSRRLMGTLVASPFFTQDPEPEKAPKFHLAAHASTPTAQPPIQLSHLMSAQISASPSPTTITTTDPSPSNPPSTFFLFPDLSCRTPGHYRLLFRLVRITPELTAIPGTATPCITETKSDVFEVFAAKDFPGMRTSTELTVGLKKAGAGIGLKKGASGAGRGGKEEYSAGEELVAEEEGGGQGGRKRSAKRVRKRKS